MSFPYKCVLLIGATSGIGHAMAERLILGGSKVIAVGRRQDRLDAFVSKHGRDKAASISFDMTDTPSIPKFVEVVTRTHPELDCVFLNAGIQRFHDFTKFDSFSVAKFHEDVTVNFNSFVNITHQFLPFLSRKPSSLIYTGSNLAYVPASGIPAYSVSKAALNTYIMCLRDQLTEAKSSVKVIELSPPAVQTELHNETMGEEKGPSFGMPLDAFTKEAYEGLASGSDQVIVGSIGDREGFVEMVDKRRKRFQWLAGIMRSAH